VSYSALTLGYSVFRISFDGELLDIISVQVEDAGRFTCEALNPAGKISKDFILSVYGKHECRVTEGSRGGE